MCGSMKCTIKKLILYIYVMLCYFKFDSVIDIMFLSNIKIYHSIIMNQIGILKRI